MPATDRPPRSGQEPSGRGVAAAGIGAALLVIVCCAGPVLVAAGALGALGGFLGNPWVITAAALLLVAAATAAVRRRTGRDVHCPPTRSTKNSSGRGRPQTPLDLTVSDERIPEHRTPARNGAPGPRHAVELDRAEALRLLGRIVFRKARQSVPVVLGSHRPLLMHGLWIADGAEDRRPAQPNRIYSLRKPDGLTDTSSFVILAGTQVTVWMDRQGRLTPKPVPHRETPVQPPICSRDRGLVLGDRGDQGRTAAYENGAAPSPRKVTARCP
ncbi:hypothetical protein [Streptomyces sp. NPDC001401]|uniref:hypothetical protein n=1 Tax=Streptomyces sp. NPDC001401 TaxID=3364570 RepID=UPI0036B63A70